MSIIHEITFGSQDYVIIDGIFWTADSSTTPWTKLVLQPSPPNPIYDPAFYLPPNYIESGSLTYRVSGGQQYLIENVWDNGFEAVDLAANGWNGTILQGPGAAVQLQSNVKHAGLQAMYCHVDNPSTPPAKAAARRELFLFRKGDTMNVEAWFYIHAGQPATLLDIEDESHTQGTGMRVLLNGNRELFLELKWPNKPKWVSTAQVPMQQWFKLRVEYLLDEINGTCKLWLDDDLKIDGTGQTIALSDTVYSRVELGITAGNVACDLAVDDVSIW